MGAHGCGPPDNTHTALNLGTQPSLLNPRKHMRKRPAHLWKGQQSCRRTLSDVLHIRITRTRANLMAWFVLAPPPSGRPQGSSRKFKDSWTDDPGNCLESSVQCPPRSCCESAGRVPNSLEKVAPSLQTSCTLDNYSAGVLHIAPNFGQKHRARPELSRQSSGSFPATFCEHALGNPNSELGESGPNLNNFVTKAVELSTSLVQPRSRPQQFGRIRATLG